MELTLQNVVGAVKLLIEHGSGVGSMNDVPYAHLTPEAFEAVTAGLPWELEIGPALQGFCFAKAKPDGIELISLVPIEMFLKHNKEVAA